MEYVQTVLVSIASVTKDRAPALREDLEAHREHLARQPGYLDMRIAPPSATDAGDEAWLIETRWRDNNSLADYTAGEPTVASIIRQHAAIIVPNSLQVFRMEASGGGDGTQEVAGVVYQRLALALLVPIGVLMFGLAVIYGLSRIYLELEGKATPLAAIIAIGILVIAFYFAANPRVPRWQYGAVVAVCAAALFGGAVYALSTEEEEHGLVEGSPTPVAEVTPGADDTPGADVTPGTTPPGGGPLELVMGDNFFSLDGEEEPTVNIASGSATTIKLTNDGAAVHNMHVADASGEYAANRCATDGPAPCSDPDRMRGGQSGEIVINIAAGTYAFRCDFHPTEMTGTLQVN